LNTEERDLLVRRLEEDEASKMIVGGHHKLIDALKNPKVWLFCLIYFGVVMGNYGLQFWLPQIIKDTLTKDPWHIGLLTMIPWGATAIVMVLVGHHSDVTGERCWHVALSAVAGGIGLALSSIPGISGPLGLAALTLGTCGIISASSSFWSLPTSYLSGAAAAGGIALINSVGNLGGFVSPWLVGVIHQTTHKMTPALLTLAGTCWMSAVITIAFFRRRKHGATLDKIT
jgi:nitrate/nitrite transporter NarK